MAREIKFRAYGNNVDKKQMLHFDMFMESLDDTMKYHIKMGDYPVMQYTGLKDKNGREIYEGDIICVYDWGIKDNKCLGKAAVKWDCEEKGWRHGYIGVDIDAYDMFRNVEVIGNIYENPELLKETK